MGRASGHSNPVGIMRRNDPRVLLPQTGKQELADRALHEAHFAFQRDELDQEAFEARLAAINSGQLRYQCHSCQADITDALARNMNPAYERTTRREARRRLAEGPRSSRFMVTCQCGEINVVPHRSLRDNGGARPMTVWM